MGGQRRAFRGWGFGIMAFLALAIGAYALVLYGSPESLKKQMFVTEKGSLPDLWYSVLWVHAVSAGIALAIGWIQFIKRIRDRVLKAHRAIGFVYAIMVVIGGLTGLYLALYASGGWVAKVGFGTLSILWLYTLYRSLKGIIIQNDPVEHGRWMMRNFALTCAAITLRIYTALAMVLLGLTDTNDTFFVIAWICWVPNLLVVEWLINRKKMVSHPSQTMPS